MSGKKAKSGLVDNAVAVIRKPKRNDTDLVAITRTPFEAAQTSPDWSTAVAVHGAMAAWKQAADAIDAQAKVVGGLQEQLKGAGSTARTLRRNWRVATRHVLGTVNVFANGSADKVRSLHFDVLTRSPSVSAPSAPEKITVARGNELGEADVRWSRGSHKQGFVVQYATDLANPSTYSAVIPSKKAKYAIVGLSPNAIVHRTGCRSRLDGDVGCGRVELLGRWLCSLRAG